MSDTLDRLIQVSNQINGYIPSLVHAYTNDPTSLDEDKLSDVTTELMDVYDKLRADAPGTLVPAIVESAPGIKPVAEPHKEDVPASPPVDSQITAEDVANDKQAREAEPTAAFEPAATEADPVEADKDK